MLAASTHTTAPDRSLRTSLPALVALSLASCLAVTSEMLPVGLLPAIGDAFAVGEATTGLLVTVFAGMVAVFSVPLTIATRRLPRRPLILATVVGYLVSNTVIAVAPTFAVVAAGRVVGGLAHALFFSVCIGYVPRVVDRAQVGRGLAIVSVGATAGFVLGVPLSTTLGSALGWRNAFGVLAVVSVAVLVLIVRVLAPVPGSSAGGVAETRGAKRDLGVVVSSNMVTFVGHYTLYTYISVVLLTAGAAESMLGPLLLVCGLCGLVGLACAGRTIDRYPRPTILTVLGLLVAAMLAVGVALPWLVATVIAVSLWNGVFGAVPSIYQSAAVRAMPDAPDLAGAWINATANVGIALGALIGGFALGSSSGRASLAWVGAVVAAAGLGIAVVGKRAFPK
ncbi:MFS transporter [Gordonia rhizosphera]|uniref:Putative major facilitator superfamily transporter n=1 Tax=Gordonia rhizosphera NBRC 16068 TaxID=1108045 RepID=K6WCL0_9ACTN|nr:MFS transporter [Gordonia rhizosphera]GAB89922.1 putative major facilitator superfamily transporter [Gordonia rhizosphera NBRC 16068]